jgi:RNA polymerase sigma-70 factor (ECF subfamily)
VPLVPRFEFDAAYVDRLTKGDEATERHFTQYFGDLLTLKLRSRLRSPALVEDAKQETFLRVLTTLRRKGGIESAGSLGAFVNSTCNNVLFETYRAESKRRQNVPEDETPLEAPSASVESVMLDADEHERVRQAIATLPDKDRDLLRSLFFEERDKDEVCRALGVDRQYLRVLLHRAKGRFREAFFGLTPTGPRAVPGPGETARRADAP